MSAPKDSFNGYLAYLATPYTKYKTGIDDAFVAAAKLTGRLIRAGIRVYSPIVHCHPVARFGGINPLDHALWIPFDESMMRAADVLIVAHMDGWKESYGVAHEIKFFAAAGKRIYDLDPLTLSMKRREMVAA